PFFPTHAGRLFVSEPAGKLDMSARMPRRVSSTLGRTGSPPPHYARIRMGLINWIFDIYQHTQIDAAKDEARAARAEVAAVRNSGGSVDGARLEQALGELALATKAVQRLMVEKGVCSNEEFARKLREIDLED